MSGNLCRCQDYDKILTALERGAAISRRWPVADTKLVGQNYTTPDPRQGHRQVEYAEDFRAEGMLFAKLLLSPVPHARVRASTRALPRRCPVRAAILRAGELPALATR